MNDSLQTLVAGELDKLRSVQRTLHLSNSNPVPTVDLPGKVEQISVVDFAREGSPTDFDLIFISLTSSLRGAEQIVVPVHVVRALNPRGVVMQVTSGEGTEHAKLPLIMMKYAVSFETNDYELRIQGKA